MHGRPLDLPRRAGAGAVPYHPTRSRIIWVYQSYGHAKERQNLALTLPRAACIIEYVDKRLGYRQVGKARDSDSRMRWFESSYPSH